MNEPACRQLSFKTPARDGEALIWPAPDQWNRLANQTAQRFAAENRARLLDVPLSAARELARRSLRPFFSGAGIFPSPAGGGMGRGDFRTGVSLVDPSRPWFVTGHQTFPFHPGIWAKIVATDAAAAAAQAGGVAVNLNLDHDLPHAGPQLAWPAVRADGQWIRRGNLTLDHRQPFERQPAPSPTDIERLCQQVSADLDPLLTEKRTCPFTLPAPASEPSSFATWSAQMRASLDYSLGLRLVEVMTSQLAEQDAFLLFFADAVARAESLHHCYNQAVAAAERVTGHLPATPLRREADRLELPFWTLRPERPGRGRLFVSAQSTGAAVTLSDDRGRIGAIASDDLQTADRAVPAIRRVLAEAGVQLRPRAITFTLFTRMLLADLFVHGIGGAVYDCATDEIFRNHFGIEPPPFAVCSATLLLPLNGEPASADELRQARRNARDLRFNPQRHLSAELLANPQAGELAAKRQAAVAENERLRQAGPSPQGRLQRHTLYLEIGQATSQLVQLLSKPIQSADEQVRQLLQRHQAAAVLTARDFFYGLFPTKRLEQLHDGIRGRFQG